MAKYKDKWKTTFPTSIGNQTRPEDGVDNTQEYNTDGLPQYMANDPVRYDLQNAVNSQLVSNDERLNEKIKRTSDDLAEHNKDPKAHATGIAGNAATASKLASPRTLGLTGKAAGSTSFDGSSNAAINVTSVNADTASKLSTARKINITGDATGAAAFDGSGDANISVTVNESKHAAAADTLKSSAATETSTVARPVWLSWEGDNTKQTVSPNLTYTCATKTLTAANFNGHLAGNADTATRATAADNADKLDGYHESSFLCYRGDAAANGEDTLWSQIGIKRYEGKLPQGISDTYIFGAVVSLPAYLGARLDIWYNHQCSVNGDGLWYRSGYSNDKKAWACLLDSVNYTKYVPTKTGSGASGTWPISISGNADTLDGYHAQDILDKSMRVGVVLPFSGNTIPDGYLPCNGAEVSRTTYKALFNVIGTTYGAGDGSATFNIPNLIDKFIEGSATVGTVKAAGLPNITGEIGNAVEEDNSYAKGAFKVGPNRYGGSGSGQNDAVIIFDASRSNAIYGASSTVQPPAVTMQYIIKY